MSFAWRKWKLGLAVSIFLSLLVAGAGVAAGMKWQAFVAVLCTALLTHVGAFLKDHPVDSIAFGEDQTNSSPMKKNLTSLLFLTALLAIAATLTFSGCTSVPKTTTTVVNGQTQTNTTLVAQADPTKVAEAVKALVLTGSVLAVEKDPNARAYLQAAAIAIGAVANQGQYDPGTVKTTLNSISVNELHSQEAQVVIQAALGLYSSYFSDVVSQKLDQTTWLGPILKAIAEGINAGLPVATTP